MKKLLSYMMLCYFLTCSCATYNPFPLGRLHGDPCPYGEGRHPGIDFDIFSGKPIIACSDGKVEWVGEPCPKERHCGGFLVLIRHGDHFSSNNMHLSKVYVSRNQSVKRGQLIGLSGPSNSGYEHLHFGIVKIWGSGAMYSQTYDPNKFWLDGKPQCFDPNKDYSSYSQKEITLPVACGDYAKELKSKTKKKD